MLKNKGGYLRIDTRMNEVIYSFLFYMIVCKISNIMCMHALKKEKLFEVLITN